MKRKIMSPEQRKAIREAYGDGSKVSLISVAYQFGVSVSTVSNIVNNDVRAMALEAESNEKNTPTGERSKNEKTSNG